MVKAGAHFFDLNSNVSLSAGHDRMVVFARRQSGELAHISEVDNGKACACFCLACHEALIARHGAVREHSFAHQSGTQCQHALEAMLYGVIQRLIEHHRHFVTPALLVSASVARPSGHLTGSRSQAATRVPVDHVAMVERAPWRRPCLEALVKGHSVLLRLALRRPTPVAAREALALAGQAAIEIDLSQRSANTVGELAQLLLGNDSRKTWLFNAKAQAMEADIRAELQPEADRQWAAHHAALQHQREQRLAQQALQQAEYLRALQQAQAERQPVASPVVSARFHPKKADLSPTVEYATAIGKLWLLHSSDGHICLRADAALTQVLDTIKACGAEPHEQAGVWRISPEGWARASMALSRHWASVRSVG